MYKAILITLLLLMCLGVIVKAEPLPLVPGATYTQQSTQTKETQLQEKKKNKKRQKRKIYKARLKVPRKMMYQRALLKRISKLPQETEEIPV